MSLSRLVTLVVVLSSGSGLALEPPWGQEKNLGQRMSLEAAAVCTDGKGHYVVMAPVLHKPEAKTQLFYGDGSRFTQILDHPQHPWKPDGAFYDPRFHNPNANDNFYGLDLRPHSLIKLDAKANTCFVQCGTRKTDFTVVEPAKARELLRQATYEPSPRRYEPYTLLRDARGTYYLVEKGILPEEQKSYRVYIGPRGRMKPQQMVNVIADSKGEIFKTKKGDLQLLLDREQPSLWIVRKSRKKLRPVPVSENLLLIYNELGVYAGARLGTPCDDL